MSLRLALGTFLLLAALPGVATGQDTGSDTKDVGRNLMSRQFPIGVWFDGRVEGINCPEGYHNVPKEMKAAKEYYQRNFQDIRDHGIEIVVIPNTPPDYRETLLSVADQVGVKIVLELVELAYPEWGGRHSVRTPDMVRDEAEVLKYCDAMTSEIRKHKSLFCYQVLDEPPANLFENFALVNRVLEKLDPAHPSFSCLCFEEELARTTAMGTQMIVFDRYPLRKPSKPGDHDFTPFRSLLDKLDHHAGKLPYWMVVQSCAMDTTTGLRYPTQAELRLMTWLSVAHNAKGIFFFLHNSYTQQERLQGLVDLEMAPHPIYGEAADLARTLKRLSPLLLRIERTSDTLVKARDAFDVQSFEEAGDAAMRKGNRYAFVVNQDVLRSASFDGEFEDASTAPKELRDLIVDVPIDVKTEGGVAKFSIRLPPGGAALLRISAASGKVAAAGQ
ncbi:MAG: hypothetical protein ACR2IE_13565 [Candidatus Sumerlaeaceae bacterium]